MRPDLFKVIVERPRIGGHGKIGSLRREKQRGEKDPEYFLKHESISLHHRCNYKTLNENLKPLLRYLKKQVGRLWDDVWSEICTQFDSQSAVQRHVRQHVLEYVDRSVWVEDDGSIWHHTYRGPELLCSYSQKHRFFYIDPRTGLLKRVPFVRRTLSGPVMEAKPSKRVSPELGYVDVGNGWYQVTFARMNLVEVAKTVSSPFGGTFILRVKVASPDVYDVLEKERMFGPYTDGRLYPEWYAVKKYQLSKKEILRLGLI